MGFDIRASNMFYKGIKVDLNVRNTNLFIIRACLSAYDLAD